jgi:hypothetical protein
LITPSCKQTTNHAISTTDSGPCLRSFIRKPENDEYETHSTGNHQSLVLTRANNAGNPQTGAAKRTSDQTAFFSETVSRRHSNRKNLHAIYIADVFDEV